MTQLIVTNTVFVVVPMLRMGILLPDFDGCERAIRFT